MTVLREKFPFFKPSPIHYVLLIALARADVLLSCFVYFVNYAVLLMMNTSLRNPITLLLLVLLLTACSHTRDIAPPTPVAPITIAPTASQLSAAAQVSISAADIKTLINKPLYRMQPEEIGRYIAYLQVLEPDLRKRIAHLGRKNLGQPYEIYLLGEFPYETTDIQPLYNLEKSDCVVFAEHTYAMALSRSWAEFFWMLQRIRYRDGVIGVTTRNHYTETDWNPQNAWLVQDISASIAGERAANYQLTVDRARFFKTRYQLQHEVPVEKITVSYVPNAVVASVESQLQEGDFVNVISGKDGGYWASHVGIVVLGPNGERRILHSAEPRVREESFAEFINHAQAREARQAAAGKPGKLLAGFKFLRLNDAPNPPPMAPQPRPQPIAAVPSSEKLAAN